MPRISLNEIPPIPNPLKPNPPIRRKLRRVGAATRRTIIVETQHADDSEVGICSITCQIKNRNTVVDDHSLAGTNHRGRKLRLIGRIWIMLRLEAKPPCLGNGLPLNPLAV